MILSNDLLELERKIQIYEKSIKFFSLSLKLYNLCSELLFAFYNNIEIVYMILSNNWKEKFKFMKNLSNSSPFPKFLYNLCSELLFAFDNKLLLLLKLFIRFFRTIFNSNL